MRFFSPPTRLALYSNLPPEECARRLTAAIDPERVAAFSLTGYGGSKGFLGTIQGRRFRIFERTWARNAPPILSGEFQANRGGTRVEGTFDLERNVKILLAIGVVPVGILLPVFVIYFTVTRDLWPWTSAALASVNGLFVLLSARILRAVGLGQERDIADFLCQTLEAGGDPSAFKSGSEP